MVSVVSQISSKVLLIDLKAEGNMVLSNESLLQMDDILKVVLSR